MNVHIAKSPEPKIQHEFSQCKLFYFNMLQNDADNNIYYQFICWKKQCIVILISRYSNWIVPPSLSDFCQLQLDPNTAHKQLILSEGNRRASHAHEVQKYPDHPERFDEYCHVMCREGLRGRCYWEVECIGDDWSVAVSYKGISRKGNGDDCRLGFNNKSWRLTHCQQSFYVRHNQKQVNISPFKFSRIGVYLDHKAGILSFYSISKIMTLIHRVQTTFTEPLYPAFGIGEGSVRIIKQRSRGREMVDNLKEGATAVWNHLGDNHLFLNGLSLKVRGDGSPWPPPRSPPVSTPLSRRDRPV